MVARIASGIKLVLNDIVGSIHDASCFGGWLLYLPGFAGDDAQIPKVVKMLMIKDTNALRLQLLEWAEIESLKRIFVSHGSITDKSPRQVLRDLANSLA